MGPARIGAPYASTSTFTCSPDFRGVSKRACVQSAHESVLHIEAVCRTKRKCDLSTEEKECSAGHCHCQPGSRKPFAHTTTAVELGDSRSVQVEQIKKMMDEVDEQEFFVEDSYAGVDGRGLSELTAATRRRAANSPWKGLWQVDIQLVVQLDAPTHQHAEASIVPGQLEV